MTPPGAVVRVLPASHVEWEELQSVFGTRGPASRCQCQRYKLEPRESFAAFPVEERAERLRRQVGTDEPGTSTSGLVAFLEDTPVGWCAVEPRPAYLGLLRSGRVPWAGRQEDRDDDGVWAVTCLFTRAGYRRRGVSRALAAAAVAHARSSGARAVEAYPMTTTDALPEELHVGTLSVFADAGLVELSRPTSRRAVMRLDL